MDVMMEIVHFKAFNECPWILAIKQLVNKMTIVFFYYNCNYKFML
jgi:hypothetical protein